MLFLLFRLSRFLPRSLQQDGRQKKKKRKASREWFEFGATATSPHPPWTPPIFLNLLWVFLLFTSWHRASRLFQLWVKRPRDEARPSFRAADRSQYSSPATQSSPPPPLHPFRSVALKVTQWRLNQRAEPEVTATTRRGSDHASFPLLSYSFQHAESVRLVSKRKTSTPSLLLPWRFWSCRKSPYFAYLLWQLGFTYISNLTERLLQVLLKPKNEIKLAS